MATIVTHQSLVRACKIISGITFIFYVGGIDWSNTHELEQLHVHFFLVMIALTPYGILVFLLNRANQSLIFQVVSFCLVSGLSMVSFGYFRLKGIPTGGWDYLLIPVWQLLLLMGLFGFFELYYFRQRSSNPD
ncbi:hypothetical protein [Methylomonas sp. TEB]|uniref:hypothetical protein n=1 Tax=Methylomonas sp. TEB TaxID=3398229 RepID=UPI0039F6344D